ncbi:hypothetical protein PIROE2DRAFT_7041 [Piromyces sp. E2]|nr:hypothetical protein PIROE2DRAFT_7041 [Piromyces sp. E2]|eukprot:OUM65881.1 hypothetical protein PIROE2DRAFT_7041 [Piromyces sp. E2]
MECENKETYINIDDENNEINNLIVKTEDNDTEVPNQDKTCESKENNSIKKEPRLLIQFSIKKVYFVTISAFSILSLLLPLLIIYNKNFYEEIISIKIEKKRIEKEARAIFNSEHSAMNKEDSKRLMYRYAIIPILYYCILSPFVEEYLFRWLIFGFIKNYGQKFKKGEKVKRSDKIKGNLIITFALIFSSILFSFAHFDLEVQMLLNIVNTLYATYMFASDCYDSCTVRSISVILPYYGIMIFLNNNK